MLRVIQVIVPLGLEGVLSYSVPEELCARVKPGVRVRVPVGRRNYVGVVFSLKFKVTHTRLEPLAESLKKSSSSEDESLKLREILEVLDEEPVVQEVQLRLWQWMAAYYMCPIGDVYRAAMPLLMKEPERLPKREKKRLPEREVTQAPFALSEAQQTAYEQIRGLWQQKQVVYLHGVTSSGKTEVYTQLILDTLQQGQSCLYLVPEIALTTQLTERLQRVLGNRLLVYHSKFSDPERYEIYQELLHRREPYVLLGARSAVLLPVQQLGLVIVDEEHERNYIQEEPAPRYNGRNVAIRLAQLTGAKVLLGSATPSVEMYYQARQGVFGLVELRTRYRDIKLPLLKVVDMREAYKRKEYTGHISDALHDDISRTLQAGKQVILFQNRRGFSPYVQCLDCGWVPKCPNCDVSLTLHRKQKQLACHYCGYSIPVPEECPDCHSRKLRGRGLGTERVEDEVAALFPEARLERMDLDTTRGKDAYQRIIDRFSRHEVDILIGTQMVTKGLDFEGVQLVGVLNADSLFSMPDYQATEHAYQLLEQVSGRAGRSGERGLVVIQTSQPEHRVISLLARHDYEQLYEDEVEDRFELHYPPFYHFLRIVMRHRDLHVLEQAGRLLERNLQQSFGKRCSLMITPALGRVQDYYIRHLLLRIERGADLPQAKRLLQEHLDWLQQQEGFKALRIYVVC